MAGCECALKSAGLFNGGLRSSQTPSQNPHTDCRAQAVLPSRNHSRANNLTARTLQNSSAYFGKKLSSPVLGARGEVERKAQGFQIRAAKRKEKERSLVLTATLIAEEGKEDEVRVLCKGLVEHYRPMVADVKSPIRSFECNQDAFEPNVVHFWERYDGYVQMNDVHAGPEHTEFMSKVRPLLTEPVALAAYEWVGGQIGHMMNPIGPKGEGGLDDATGQGGSGGGASYKQTAQTDLGNIVREEWGMEAMAKGIDKVKNMFNVLSGKK